jgi:DNA polymerase-4/protein ImuB
MQVLCVLLPHFPFRCEVYRSPQIKGHASVLIQESGSQKLVLDYSPEFADLQQGMELQGALSRHDDIQIIHADIPYYWNCFNQILDAMEYKNPVVEGAELGLIYLSMDGMQIIYHNDNDFVNAAREAIPDGFVTKVGIGQSKFLAYLAARQSPPDCGFRVLSGDIGSYLKNLSCEVLPVSIRIQKKLHEFGIHTLGQITALPLGPVQAQFGSEGRRIWELARGQDETPLYPRSTEEIIEENTTLNWVTISIEAMVSIVESLLAKALASKILHGRGITCLTVWTRGCDSRRWEKVVNFKEPAMDVKSALPRIKYFFENYPQPGPVEQVGLKLTRLGYSIGRQKSIFAEIRAKDHLLGDIKQLELRLDGPQVYQVKEIEPWSRIPERRYALAPLSQ